ncbi:UTP--glucose-1-phosphate uridylyltransferase [Hydrogenophaga sp.]|uniref:UTP--glucose-1-phosphate uridylyltransferase n=1 Tax=Hydrogenophaga sp. TaxID=1904254 RepID=UPI002627D1CF|nr:sugar phosphate nucleotidyltransferase [Hydrogenophaga sp.]
MKAVFPLGGYGAYRLPASKTIPAEMIPLLDKPLIQYAVEEAYAAGFREMLFVSGHSLRSVEDHFDLNLELEHQLEQSNESELLQLVRAITPGDMSCAFVRQPRSLGIGNALLCVEHLLKGEPFALLLPQEIWLGNPPVLEQLLGSFEQTQRSLLGVAARDEKFVSTAHNLRKLDSASRGYLEREHVGRCIFTGDLFIHLKRQRSVGYGYERISLSSSIEELAAAQGVHILPCAGRRYDCGTREGHLRAMFDLAIADESLASDLTNHLLAGSLRLQRNDT